MWSIAQRIVGDDQHAVAAYADQVLDLNLGTRMPDGQVFTNAAYIEIGWVLQLPAGAVTAGATGSAPGTETHVVEPGETLWSIADDELGDGERWPEIYDANEGRTFDDGRRLTDPNLIVPGWDLDLSTDDAARPETSPEDVPAGADVPAPDDAPAEAESAGVGVDAALPLIQDISVHEEAEVLESVDRPDNAWLTDDDAGLIPVVGVTAGVDAPDGAPTGGSAVDASSTNAVPDPADIGADEPEGSSDEGVQLLTLERAAMLSAGVLTLLAVRRRHACGGRDPTPGCPTHRCT